MKTIEIISLIWIIPIVLVMVLLAFIVDPKDTFTQIMLEYGQE